MKIDVEKNYLNHEACKRCEGSCCKNMPGIAIPEDFGQPLLDNLVKAFGTGDWAIDWWEGDPVEDREEIDRGYYIRPKIKGVNKIYHGAWGGICVFFTEGQGCKLSDKDRPAQCRLLEPKKNEQDECELHELDKQEGAIAWLLFHDVIEKAVKLSNL